MPTPSNDLINLAERESLLRATPAFRDLTVSELSQLSSMIKEVSYDAGETVVAEDELIDSVYIIANGTLEVTREVKTSGKSGTTFLAILNVGESIGLKEGGLFSEIGRRTATVKAMTPCILLKIDIKAFDSFVSKHAHSLQSMKNTTDLVMKMQFIKASNPFMQLSNQRITWLANSVKFIDVNHGDIIFKENDPVDNCYMIVTGEVEFVVTDKNGKEKILNTLRDGELFGERALFKNAKRVATARAVKTTHLMVLDQDTLEELQEETVDVSDAILSESTEYNRPIRKENIIHHHRDMPDGQVVTVLKDSLHNKYLQLNEEGWYIWQQLSGQVSVQEICKLFSDQFNRFDPPTVMKTINTMVNEGFADADVMQIGIGSAIVSKSQKGKTWVDSFQYIYTMKHSDRKFDKLYRYGGFIFFNLPVLILSLAIIIAGIYVFPSTLSQTFSVIHKVKHVIFFLIWIIFISSLLRLISPFVKAMTIKYFNHSIPRFTIGWHFIFPVAFVDTSDLWLSSRFPRVMTMLSGIISTLLIASLLTLFAYYKPASLFMLTASLSSIILYFLALRSLDPLIETDGYHALLNALDAPKLRESALTWFTQGLPGLWLKHRKDVIRQRNILYFIYYIVYIILNFLFIIIIQRQLMPFNLPWLWNDWAIYLILAAGLSIEFLIEINHLKKIQQILVMK